MIENGQNLGISDFSQSEASIIPESERFITLSAPITLQWEITPWCNEKCIHCYNYWRQDQAKNPTPTPESLAVLERATSEIVNNKVFNVTVTGGEPLSVFRYIYPLMERLRQNGVGIAINTNLTMLTRDKARALGQIGVRSILTSLSSGDANLNDTIAGRKIHMLISAVELQQP